MVADDGIRRPSLGRHTLVLADRQSPHRPGYAGMGNRRYRCVVRRVSFHRMATVVSMAR